MPVKAVTPVPCRQVLRTNHVFLHPSILAKRFDTAFHILCFKTETN